MTKIHYILLSTILTLATAAHSAEALVLTFANLGDRVRSQNPDLIAARHLVDEALGRQLQSGRLTNPELEFEVQQNDYFNENRIGVGLSQQFPLTHRLKLEKELGAKMVMEARSEIREVENRLIGQAREACVRTLIARQRIKLIEQQAGLATELAEFLSAAAERAEASTLEAAQARLACLPHEVELKRLAALQQRSIGALKPLLGMTPQEMLVVSGGLPGVVVPGANVVKQAPAVESAQLAIDSAGKQVEIERSKRVEDLTAGVFAAYERSIDEPEGVERDWLLGLKLSMPLPWWDGNEGNIQAAEAKEKRRRAEMTAVQSRLSNEAEAARSEMDEWVKLIGTIDRKWMPQAEEQTNLSEKAWRDGLGDLVAVLRAREQRLELAVSRLDALEGYHLANVRRLTAIGIQ